MITLRKATMADSGILLAWKNDPQTRLNSIVTPGPVFEKSHVAWLEQKLSNPSTEFSIIQKDGVDVGALRLEHSDGGEGETEIVIHIDPAYRGMGLATEVVSRLGGTLTAKVVDHNLASMNVFIANGFRPYKHIVVPNNHITPQVRYYIFKKCPR